MSPQLSDPCGCPRACTPCPAVCMSCNPSSASMLPGRTRHLQAVVPATEEPSRSCSKSSFTVPTGSWFFGSHQDTRVAPRVDFGPCGKSGLPELAPLLSARSSGSLVASVSFFSSVHFHHTFVCLFVCLFVWIRTRKSILRSLCLEGSNNPWEWLHTESGTVVQKLIRHGPRA